MSYSDIANLISAEGRAYLPSVKDLPPDQAQQHAIDAAKRGLIRFSDAIAIKGAADRVGKSAQSEAPPPGNVINDLKAQIRAALSGQQAPMQQMPQQGMPPQGMPPQGMPPQGMPPQGMPPQGAPPQPGLAGLPVSNIGTQAMAGGGIVAFADGGGVSESDWLFGSQEGPYVPFPQRNSDGSRIEPPREPLEEGVGARQEEAPPEGNTDIGAMLRASFMRGPAPIDSLDTYRKKAEAENVRLGIGNALNKKIGILAKRAEEEKGLSAEDRKKFKSQLKQDVAAAYFAAAAEGDKTALGAIASGLSKSAQARSAGAKEERAIAREEKRAQQSLEDANLAVEEAQETLRFNTSEKAQQRYDAAVAQQAAAKDRLDTLGANIYGTDATIMAANARGTKYTTANVVADFQMKKEAALQAAAAAPKGSKAQKEALAAAEYNDRRALDESQYLPTASTWAGADKAAFNRFFEADETQSDINLARTQLKSVDPSDNAAGMARLRDRAMMSPNPEEFMRRVGVSAGSASDGAGAGSTGAVEFYNLDTGK
jgi:hypothetical protein